MKCNKLKKRLIFYSNNRGLKETDILLGNFVTKNIDDLDEEHLNLLDKLLKQADIDIFNWITNKEKTPIEFDNNIMKMLRNQINNSTSSY